jgi:adenylate kinase
MMRDNKEKELISEFDTIRKAYLEEERTLQNSYAQKFQDILDKIADERKVRRVKIQ